MGAMKIKAGGSWHTIKQPWVKVSGQWKKVKAAWVKQGGQWRQIWAGMKYTMKVGTLRMGTYGHSVYVDQANNPPAPNNFEGKIFSSFTASMLNSNSYDIRFIFPRGLAYSRKLRLETEVGTIVTQKGSSILGKTRWNLLGQPAGSTTHKIYEMMKAKAARGESMTFNLTYV